MYIAFTCTPADRGSGIMIAYKHLKHISRVQAHLGAFDSIKIPLRTKKRPNPGH
jgi:hypothetical protein